MQAYSCSHYCLERLKLGVVVLKGHKLILIPLHELDLDHFCIRKNISQVVQPVATKNDIYNRVTGANREIKSEHLML